MKGAEPPPPADGRSRGSAAPHPPRAVDAAARGTERSRVGARVLLGVGFDPAMHALDCRI
jgi:hypothetical protein